MTRDDITLLGTIVKTHGVRGELILRTADPSFELNENWESIFLQIDGILVPFFISGLRPFKSGEWVIKFDWYEDRNRAETLLGYSAWCEQDQLEAPEDELFLDDLLGYTFRDKTSGRSGHITGFMDIPENPVFEAESGTDTYLIPAREEMILEVDTEKRNIIFELPEGII
jgi:16S rRNA processing protein RimM